MGNMASVAEASVLARFIWEKLANNLRWETYKSGPERKFSYRLACQHRLGDGWCGRRESNPLFMLGKHT